MRTAILTRIMTGDEGTFGQFIADTGFTCITGELPWKNNKTGISCIPNGEYLCGFRLSPKHGKRLYHVDGVPDRFDVEIHSGNWCGDVSKDKKSDVRGCVLPGLKTGELEGQMAVISSKIVLDSLEKTFNYEPFRLTVRWAEGKEPRTEEAS